MAHLDKTVWFSENDIKCLNHSCGSESGWCKLFPTEKLVFKQWLADEDNDLLITGYSELCKVRLPSDIAVICAKYYSKPYSIDEILKMSKGRNVIYVHHYREDVFMSVEVPMSANYHQILEKMKLAIQQELGISPKRQQYQQENAIQFELQVWSWCRYMCESCCIPCLICCGSATIQCMEACASRMGRCGWADDVVTPQCCWYHFVGCIVVGFVIFVLALAFNII